VTGAPLAPEDLRDLVMLEVHDRLPIAGAIATRCAEPGLDATHLRVGVTIEVSVRVTDESTATNEALPSILGRELSGMLERELLKVNAVAQAERDKRVQQIIGGRILRAFRDNESTAPIIDQLASGTLDVTL
jgi:hypothetical protein